VLTSAMAWLRAGCYRKPRSDEERESQREGTQSKQRHPYQHNPAPSQHEPHLNLTWSTQLPSVLSSETTIIASNSSNS
jgi:hypothetical protein